MKQNLLVFDVDYIGFLSLILLKITGRGVGEKANLINLDNFSHFFWVGLRKKLWN